MYIYLGSTWDLHKAQRNAGFPYKKHPIGRSTREHEYKYGKGKKYEKILFKFCYFLNFYTRHYI